MRSPHTSYRWRGERVIEPIKCMRSPHTSSGGEERVIEPIDVDASHHHTSLQVELGEIHRPNQVDAAQPTTPLQVEREREGDNRANPVYAAHHTHQPFYKVERKERVIESPIQGDARFPTNQLQDGERERS